MKASLLLLVFAGVVGCGAADGQSFPDAAGSSDARLDSTPSFGDGGAGDDAAVCDPPDMLIVLDRSDSMGSSAGKDADGGALPSKWELAKDALDHITAPPADEKLRFGLEVLPKASGLCGTGEPLVAMDLGTGATIATTLSTTKLVYGTPIGGALAVAVTTLSNAKVPDRDQYVILVTDGAETCSSNGPLPIVQSLAAAGVKTYVIGFGAAVDKALLNDLACAGRTATKLSTACKQSGSGYVSAGGTAPLYFSATDGTSLQTALATITGSVCCGCVN